MDFNHFDELISRLQEPIKIEENEGKIYVNKQLRENYRSKLDSLKNDFYEDCRNSIHETYILETFQSLQRKLSDIFHGFFRLRIEEWDRNTAINYINYLDSITINYQNPQNAIESIIIIKIDFFLYAFDFLTIIITKFSPSSFHHPKNPTPIFAGKIKNQDINSAFNLLLETKYIAATPEQFHRFINEMELTRKMYWNSTIYLLAYFIRGLFKKEGTLHKVPNTYWEYVCDCFIKKDSSPIIPIKLIHSKQSDGTDTKIIDGVIETLFNNPIE